MLKQKLMGVALEFTVPEDWAAFQTPIREIEDLTFGLVDFTWRQGRDILLGAMTTLD